ncbi:3-oxoacyl-[acyl-carrier-protein] reductase FabG [Rubripirellula obstinata]|uniref:3-oxoacyl-[acyl-carrier-protein] reductase FabG n=1 Tax=Rubripirellula obstinata TaxID=406547 RepID=A0A5B1CL09_9BACT|nr:SDR family oxidoreductase [Rubripirellula obstinata]KAA1260014.1 3-oxoacyl-[acyl-carrier-protein] reductase FabG [Rubripirellula obstinata]
MSPKPAFSSAAAVVTGSSSGIGRATISALAKAGASQLVVHYCANQRGAEETAKIAWQSGCEEVFVVQADLQIPSQRDHLAEVAFKKFGRVDAWINNAGADVLTGDAAKLSFAEKLQWLWRVDVQATIELSRNVAQRMLEQTTSESNSEKLPPSMTFIGWDQAPLGMEGDAGQMFGPIKAAVMAFANSMAQEFSPDLRINTVAPGWIQTSWGESTSDYWDSRAKAQSLMQRWGTPDDVAKAILYAADPANTFTTGQTIAVDGGWSRRFQG